MPRQLFHIYTDNSGRLICDNPICKHELPEALPFTEELVGYPCPKCGVNMLTRADYEGQKRMIAIINWLNKWFGWLGSERDDPRNKSVGMRVHHNTTIHVEDKT
jgi:hypothetical protein